MSEDYEIAKQLEEWETRFEDLVVDLLRFRDSCGKAILIETTPLVNEGIIQLNRVRAANGLAPQPLMDFTALFRD